MNKITINGIELELTDEQAAGLVEQYQKRDDWPQTECEYWYVCYMGVVKRVIYSTYHDLDLWNKSIGNCFRTREEAEHYRDYLVALNTLKKSSDFVPDWDDGSQKKWGISCMVARKEFTMTYDQNLNYAIPVYYHNEEEALNALAKYRREFEIVYGIVK